MRNHHPMTPRAVVAVVLVFWVAQMVPPEENQLVFAALACWLIAQISHNAEARKIVLPGLIVALFIPLFQFWDAQAAQIAKTLVKASVAVGLHQAERGERSHRENDDSDDRGPTYFINHAYFFSPFSPE